MLLFFIILLTGCSYTPYVTKEVVLSSPHVYESFGLDVPYYLDYYDGEKFHRLFLPSGVKKVRLSFKGYALCPVVASPFGFSAPAIGSASVPGKDEVSLSEREGLLAFSLLEAAMLNAESVTGLNYPKLVSMVPPSFDEVRFKSQVTAGTFTSFREYSKFSVMVSDLPSGQWFSASTEVENIVIGREGDSVSLELYPGLYSFLNPERHLEYILEVFEDGKTRGRVQN